MKRNLKINYAIICILFFIVSLIINHFLKINPIDPDSLGYINFAETRTVGYPTVIWFFQSLFNSVFIITLFQLAIFSFSAWYLSLTVDKLFQKNGWGYFILACLFFNPYWFKTHFMILTESLSSSVLCLFLGSMISYFYTKKISFLFFSSFWVGIGILIRPINYAWLSGLVFLFFYAIVLESSNNVLKKVTSLLTPLTLVLIIGSSIYYTKHGSFKTQSFLGHNLIGKAALFTDESVPSKDPQFIKALEIVTKNYITPLENTTYIQNYYYIGAIIYDSIRYSYFSKILNEYGTTKNVNDDFLAKRSFEIIKHKKCLYMKDLIINLSALWLLLDFKTHSEKNSIAQIIQAIPENYRINISKALQMSKSWPLPTVWLVRTILSILFLLSLTLLLLPFVQLFKKKKTTSSTLLAASVSGAVIHCTFLATAFVQAGLPRYAFSLWPCLFVITAILGNFILTTFSKLKQRNQEKCPQI